MTHQNIQAVIFDLDGTLIDTERTAQRAWQRAFAEFGFALPDDVYLQAVGRTAPDTHRLWRAVLGEAVPLDDIRARKQTLLDGFYASEDIALMPGALELLEVLHERRTPRAVATSTLSEAAHRKLRRTGLHHRFDAVVCGDEVAHGKPAPDIFLEAARRLHVDPSNCVVIEDSEAGVRAAHAAGAPVLMVPNMKPASDALRLLARAVFADLHQVLAWLQSQQ